MIDKPWGGEEILYSDMKYTLKKLVMKKDQMCSLQYHEKKQETVYVLDGILKMTDRITDVILYPGDTITIYPGEIHRMIGITDATYLECSTSELDDVVRIEDAYGRI